MMARDFDNDPTNNHITFAPSTLGDLIDGAAGNAWRAHIRLDTLTTARVVFNAHIDTGSKLGVGPQVSSSDELIAFARSQSADGAQSRTTVEAFNADTWYSTGADDDIDGDAITPYINGGADNGGGVTFGASTYTQGTPDDPYQDDAIGCFAFKSGATTAYASSLLGAEAEVALYKLDIGSSAHASLGKGFTPDQVRPDLLVAYWPLKGRRSPEPDMRGSAPATITGTVPQFSHPRTHPRRAAVYH